jgi:hypothetical protein
MKTFSQFNESSQYKDNWQNMISRIRSDWEPGKIYHHPAYGDFKVVGYNGSNQPIEIWSIKEKETYLVGRNIAEKMTLVN